MAKYSFEFKKKIVKEYLEGKGGIKTLAIKHGVRHHSSLEVWIKSYKEFGDEGLLRKRCNEKYTFEFKLSMVELYLTTEISYQDLALSAGMNNPPLITKWVNGFRIAGPDALREKTKGRRPQVSTQKKKKMTAVESNDTLKRLEDENLKLRIENAYLKELRRLRLAEEAQNNARELSTASEENSN